MQQPNTIEVEHGERICCPICAQVVLDLDRTEDEGYFQACDHTLYVAHDMGIDYASDILREVAVAAGVELDDEEVDPRELMKKSSVQDVHYFETYAPAPSFYGTYVAFHKN